MCFVDFFFSLVQSSESESSKLKSCRVRGAAVVDPGERAVVVDDDEDDENVVAVVP